MSDWAANLSKKPQPPQAGPALPKNFSSREKSPPSVAHQKQPQGTKNTDKQGDKQTAKASDDKQTAKASDRHVEKPPEKHAVKPAAKHQKPAKSGHKQEARTRESASPEPFSSSEVLRFLSGRFEAELAEAKSDKEGAHAVVYRSLDSSSSWKTRAYANGKGFPKEGGSFNILHEINRSMHQKFKK